MVNRPNLINICNTVCLYSFFFLSFLKYFFYLFFVGQGQQQKGQQDGLEGHNNVLTSSSTSTNSSSRPRNRGGGHLTRVRQSRSLNRISELHVVADFSESETDLLKTTDLLTRYLETVHSAVNNRSATRQGLLNRWT